MRTSHTFPIFPVVDIWHREASRLQGFGICLNVDCMSLRLVQPYEEYYYLLPRGIHSVAEPLTFLQVADVDGRGATPGNPLGSLVVARSCGDEWGMVTASSEDPPGRKGRPEMISLQVFAIGYASRGQDYWTTIVR